MAEPVAIKREKLAYLPVEIGDKQLSAENISGHLRDVENSLFLLGRHLDREGEGDGSALAAVLARTVGQQSEALEQLFDREVLIDG